MSKKEQINYIISLLYQLGLVVSEGEAQPVPEVDHDFQEIVHRE